MASSQHTLRRALCLTGALSGVAMAQSPYSIDTRAETLETARTLAYDMMLYYDGNQTGMTPGILPGPPDSGTGDYYWWQGGAMMAAYLDYWYWTGDESYNDVVFQGMLHQVGEEENYEPRNHTLSLGNDDQGFWGMSAMLAAEVGFRDPPEDQPQWLALAQGVWNRMALPERHDTECNGGRCCGGGMRWQIPPNNGGYDYKNTISNGCFFNIGARLARYTGNETYVQRAEETWDWLWNVNYIDHDLWRVYDGGHVPYNCTNVVKITYSYNIGILLQGAAFLYNHTNGSDVWRGRIENLTSRMMRDFFPNNTAYEVSCEPRKGTCSRDMLMFKGFVHRWLPTVAQLAPFTADAILPVLRDSARAAIAQCTGRESGRACGFYWADGVYVDTNIDKTSGAGEALNVLSAVVGTLIDGSKEWLTNSTGGTSRGNPNAGLGSHQDIEFRPLTTADRAGAGIITALFCLAAAATFVWMSMPSRKQGEYEGPPMFGLLNLGRTSVRPVSKT